MRVSADPILPPLPEGSENLPSNQGLDGGDGGDGDKSKPVQTHHPNDSVASAMEPNESTCNVELVPNDSLPAEQTKSASSHLSSTSDKINVEMTTIEKVVRQAAPTMKKCIINPEMNVNERDDDENTALHIAIHARKLEHVRILLEAGASLRMRSDGSMPIHTAISIGAFRDQTQFAYECVLLLHEHGADLTVKDDSIHTPLFLSCMFNLPQIASYILSDEEGLLTLNSRADRAGNRPLHASAKFDTMENPSVCKTDPIMAMGHSRCDDVPIHPDFSSISPQHSTHVDPDSAGKSKRNMTKTLSSTSDHDVTIPHSTEALLTQVLIGTKGIEIDSLNVMGQTPLHIACMRKNWPVARLLLKAGADPNVRDRRGYTPGQMAYKRAMPIPLDLVSKLGENSLTGIIPPVRDLIVDPDARTLLLCHELCSRHHTCPPITRDSPEPPPENIRRLHVLLDAETGILRTGEFGNVIWKMEARRASIVDVLKVCCKDKTHVTLLKKKLIFSWQVHEYSYVERVSLTALSIPDNPNSIAHLDGDTAISRWSFEAAMHAAGAVCDAVDNVVMGDNIRNAFCAVRPPGHHAGPRGIVRCANDPEGSHGFCLLNNICIGAAYARSMYRNEGIQKIAIIDFDVHHGNGTEAVIRSLVPQIEKSMIRTPFATGDISTSSYRPWLDETDIQDIFFASTHGYGNRGFDQPGWFYPGSGKSHFSDAIMKPTFVEIPNTADFLLSQTWARIGEESIMNCCKVINVGLDLPESEMDIPSRNMKQRLELRDTYRKVILPRLHEFDPDLIFISAGFDAHRKDSMNFGYVGMVEDDYEWLTDQLIKIANACCNGRVISVLEGGYKVHGGIVSPFARSVASHVRALVDGGCSRELYDPQESERESIFEQEVYEKRERRKLEERKQLLEIEVRLQETLKHTAVNGEPYDPDAPSRKRPRKQVDYKELFKQMQQEGFAG